MFLQRRTFTRTSPPVSGLFQTFIFTHRFSRKFAFCGGDRRSTCLLQQTRLNFPDLWPGGSLHWRRHSMLYLSTGSFKWLICSPLSLSFRGFLRSSGELHPDNAILASPILVPRSPSAERTGGSSPSSPSQFSGGPSDRPPPPHLCSILYNLFG